MIARRFRPAHNGKRASAHPPVLLMNAQLAGTAMKTPATINQKTRKAVCSLARTITTIGFLKTASAHLAVHQMTVEEVDIAMMELAMIERKEQPLETMSNASIAT